MAPGSAFWILLHAANNCQSDRGSAWRRQQSGRTKKQWRLATLPSRHLAISHPSDRRHCRRMAPQRILLKPDVAVAAVALLLAVGAAAEELAPGPPPPAAPPALQASTCPGVLFGPAAATVTTYYDHTIEGAYGHRHLRAPVWTSAAGAARPHARPQVHPRCPPP